MSISKYYQSGDWKGEKHVPVIDAPATVESGKAFEVTVQVGKEIAHPNTLEHHIGYIKLFFLADGAKFPVELGSYDFRAHGEGECLSNPKLVVSVSLAKSGKLIASSYCNIHGLWESESTIAVK